MTDFLLSGTAHVHTPEHVRAIEAAGGRVVAVMDHAHARARHWAETLGARVVTRATEADAEVAIVAAENARHEEAILDALDAGLSVLCEKPLAPDAAAARRMTSAAEEAGLVLDTAFSLMADPAVSGLAGRVRTGTLGRVLSARVRYAHDGALASWLDLSGWMTDPAEAVYGGFGDEGVHALDWLMRALGPVASGTVRLGHAMGFGVDDHGVALLAMESGATAVLEGSWVDRALHAEIEVLGTEACARLAIGRADGRATIVHRDGTELWSADAAPIDAGAAVAPFLQSVREGAPPLTPPAQSVAVIETLERLYAGAAAGRGHP